MGTDYLPAKTVSANDQMGAPVVISEAICGYDFASLAVFIRVRQGG